MRIFLFLIVTLLICPPGHAQHSIDGPYVFYVDSNTVSYTLNKGLVRSALNPSHVTVVPQAKGMKAFEVELRSNVIIPASVYEKPGKLLVLSDIEGEFDVLYRLLLKNGVMNRDYAWTFGAGHLVIAGDMFDRGKDVLPVLWLLYKLEREAEQAGGYVHVILGNHDIMNLSGDFRYVDKKYQRSAALMSKTYAALFNKETLLGQWLRSKNIVEKIGDLLVLHGGISPEMNRLALSVDSINALMRPVYDAASKTRSVTQQLLAGASGPFWYRGYFMPPSASEAIVDSTLRLYGCKNIIVGHTIMPGHVGT